METPVFDAPTVCLLALSALVAGLFLRGVAVADAAPGSGGRSRRVLPAALGLALWLGLTAMLAAKGRLLNENSMPPPFARIMVPGLILVFAAAFSGFGRRLASRLSYAALIGFQAFRLPLEGLLWWFHRQGRLPVQMTFAGRNWDVLTGISALAVAALIRNGRLGTRAALIWNLAGLALLLNIMAVAVLSLPGPLNRFPGEPENTLVLHFPYVWIPALFVMAAFFGHLLVFRKLLMPK